MFPYTYFVKRRATVVLLACLLAIPLSMSCISTKAFGQLKEAPDGESTVNEKVSKLFEEMREGNYRRNLFPKLEWSDIPSLLKVAESTTTLKNFPTNPLSSMLYPDCLEGEVALWLIEGIRKDSKFPSLNCRLADWENGSPVQRDHEDACELHERALKLYQKWWSEVGLEPSEESLELEPLQNADPKLRWR